MGIEEEKNVADAMSDDDAGDPDAREAATSCGAALRDTTGASGMVIVLYVTRTPHTPLRAKRARGASIRVYAS